MLSPPLGTGADRYGRKAATLRGSQAAPCEPGIERHGTCKKLTLAGAQLPLRPRGRGTTPHRRRVRIRRVCPPGVSQTAPNKNFLLWRPAIDRLPDLIHKPSQPDIIDQ